ARDQHSDSAEDAVIDFLESRTTLLMLDNCEGHTDSVASLVKNILQNCPRTSILTTSREILNVRGEQVFPLNSLPFPEFDVESEFNDRTDFQPSQLRDYEAVEFFVSRARQFDHNF